DRDRGAIPRNAQVHHAHAARAQPRGQPGIPEPGRVIRPERRASQQNPPPERSSCRPGRSAQSPACYFPTVSAGCVPYRQPEGRLRTTNCWLAWVWTESMPVTAEPDAASAVMAWLPPSVRPLTDDRVQLVPLAEVQTAAAVVPPDEPNRAAAVNPPPLAVSAVKLTP